jgi:hypothetical protein
MAGIIGSDRRGQGWGHSTRRPELALLRLACVQREINDDDIAETMGISRQRVKQLWQRAEGVSVQSTGDEQMLRLDHAITETTDRRGGLKLPGGIAEEFQEWLAEYRFSVFARAEAPRKTYAGRRL